MATTVDVMVSRIPPISIQKMKALVKSVNSPFKYMVRREKNVHMTYGIEEIVSGLDVNKCLEVIKTPIPVLFNHF